MADSDKPRRGRRPFRAGSNSPEAVDPASDSAPAQGPATRPDRAGDDDSDRGGNGPKTPASAAPTRSARTQALQDVHDAAEFLAKVDQRRRDGHQVPAPKPMKEVIAAFRGSPQDQTMIQVLASAATARHLEGPQSSNALRWQKLAQDNAARLAALRQHARRSDLLADARNGTTPDQVTQREAQRTEQESHSDKRIFDASAALAMGYVAARGLPAFDTLSDLSDRQLDTSELDETTTPAGASDPFQAAAEASEQFLGPSLETEGDQADHSPTELPSNRGDDIGQIANRVGRGLAQAVGTVVGDDEAAPNMSPVNLAHLTEELLGALGAVRLGHPRSVTEMLNTERTPDETNELAFDPGAEVDRGVDKETEAAP